MNLNAIISTERVKRLQRMHDAVKKARFRIQSRNLYRSEDKTATIWEVWSNHTHRRSPRLYVVSRVEARGRITWNCTCPDFEANGHWFPCKHILYIQNCGV